MNLFDGTDLLETTSTEIKNRILKPGQMLRAIDTGALYYGDKDGKPTAFVGASTSSSGGVRILAGDVDTGLGVRPPTPIAKYDTITLPPPGGTGVYAVKTGPGFISEIRCLVGSAVPLILQDSPSRRVGRTIYSGTLSAGQTVKFADWETFGVSGIFADYLSAAATAQFEFMVG